MDPENTYTPEQIAEMTPEQIAEAIETARTEGKALVAADAPSDEDVAKAKELAATINALQAEADARAEVAAAKEAELAEVRDLFPEDGPEDEDGEEAPEDEEPVAEVEEEVEETPEPVAAAPKKGGVATLARTTPKPKRPAATNKAVKITAANNVEGFNSGQNLGDLGDVAKAVINRAKGFAPPTGDGTTTNIQQFGTAMLELDFPSELTVDRFDDAQEAMDLAVQESRLPGGSLVAAGGWCAPSETIYDLTQDATTEGMLSLPEIGVKRGGIRFAGSPTFADFYANPGFIQTEAQAIAGTTKPCVEVDCPDFSEVRLDAEGICIKVPILTNAAYPEVVKNFVAGSLVAHQHWINANVIGRLVTAAGAARVIDGLGSSMSDALDGLMLLANQTRQKYRLSLNSSLEVVLPFWLMDVYKTDLSRRTGQLTPVTDGQLKAFFTNSKLAVQFVYDWQLMDETAEVYPATYQALMYPAGTFVKGTATVITLNTIYDAASLATNVYTGLFTEQGLLVAKKKFHADLITLPICNAGRTGAANFTCA